MEIKRMEHGWPVINLSIVDSTNSYILRLIESGKASRELVVNARFQSQGRGQESNTWESDPYQNLTFSLYLLPNYLKGDNMFVLNQAISLSIIDFLKDYQILSHIKWPNDILIGNKKIAGILIENSFIGDTFQYAVIGIGLNVNQELFCCAKQRAISMKTLLGKDLNLDIAFQHLLNAINFRVSMLKNADFNRIISEYKENLYLLNSWSNYSTNGNTFKGKIVDVKTTGELCVSLEDGKIKTFQNKEIVFC
jgi:BirA family biotin operon repressor/biotin-[acetyl-CoA-carboxylase] ligase